MLIRIIAFPGWHEGIHGEPEQVKRQMPAMSGSLQPQDIDMNTKSCCFKGSAKTPYIVTLSKCTCVDFERRKLPCKHIYRLAHEVGCIELPFGKSYADIEKNILQSYRRTGPWGNWHPDLHKLPDQKTRIDRAGSEMMEIAAIDRQLERGRINYYWVTLESCTCADFEERGLPCKHIYRLHQELSDCARDGFHTPRR